MGNPTQTILIPIWNSTDKEQTVVFEPRFDVMTLPPKDKISVAYAFDPDSVEQWNLTIEFDQDGSLRVHCIESFKVWRGDTVILDVALFG